MLSMLCLVVVFGVHSLVDWTWYVPGDAFVALVCAGWLAGRGPLHAYAAAPPQPANGRPCRATATAGIDLGAGGASTSGPSLAPGGSARGAPAPGKRARERAFACPALGARSVPMRVGVATAAVIASLLAAWSQWQPQRSVDSSQEALALLSTNPHGALAKAQTAVARDPLSAQALIVLAAVQQSAGEPALAKATLQRAVRLQPSNPQTWLALARHDLASEPALALKELQAAIYLNPESIAPEAIAPPYANPESVEIYNDYVQALRATGTASVTGTARPRSAVGAFAAAGAAARLRPRRVRRHRRGRGRAPHQRERTARASSSRRAPGGPATARTETSWNPNSPSSRVRPERV